MGFMKELWIDFKNLSQVPAPPKKENSRKKVTGMTEGEFTILYNSCVNKGLIIPGK
jgi:hypothetical protein